MHHVGLDAIDLLLAPGMLHIQSQSLTQDTGCLLDIADLLCKGSMQHLLHVRHAGSSIQFCMKLTFG